MVEPPPAGRIRIVFTPWDRADWRFDRRYVALVHEPYLIPYETKTDADDGTIDEIRLPLSWTARRDLANLFRALHPARRVE